MTGRRPAVAGDDDGVSARSIRDAADDGNEDLFDPLRLVDEDLSPAEPLATAAPDKTRLWLEAEAALAVRRLRVRSHALRVFDGPALARSWLENANAERGEEMPIDMARTDIGAREVEAALLRIEHGSVG